MSSVEPPDRHDARLGRDELDDGRSPVGVARGRDDAGRLVQEDVRERLARDALAVDLDDVPPPHDGVQLARLPVHAHAPLADELVRAPARGDSCAGEVRVQSHRGHSRQASVGSWPRSTSGPTSSRELAVFGANVQPGQLVSVTSYIGKEELTRKVARAAYERGAKYVDVLYFDQWLKRERVALADEDTLDYIPPWMRERLLYLSDEHAARITLSGPHAPRALEGLDPARAGRDLLPYLPETGEVVNRMTTSWCIVPAPTRSWAEIVYPELEREAAYERLWEDVAHICRLDADDPAEAWMERSSALKANARRLTEQGFDAIRLHGPGTDLTIGLLPSAHWAAGDLETVDGRRHSPNLPTEELFTTPDPERVDGHVAATHAARALRLDHHGHPGRVRRRSRGEDRRRRRARRRYGRSPPETTAPRASASSRSWTAPGVSARSAASSTTRSSTRTRPRTSRSATATTTRSRIASEKKRINKSRVHVDFMIGSPELDVDGITRDGHAVPVRGGAWQL